ncbi:hypothetical protein ACVMIH_000064 [Bradyrhizobium sp. USDA 4503]
MARATFQLRKVSEVPLNFSNTSLVVIGSTLFAIASSTFLYAIPPSRIDQGLLRGTFRLYRGHAYLIPVKYVDGDLRTAHLYEDDKLLGPANSTPPEIEANGAGRFALIKDYIGYQGPVLLLSTSDNTDPNANGRKYHLK